MTWPTALVTSKWERSPPAKKKQRALIYGGEIRGSYRTRELHTWMQVNAGCVLAHAALFVSLSLSLFSAPRGCLFMCVHMCALFHACKMPENFLFTTRTRCFGQGFGIFARGCGHEWRISPSSFRAAAFSGSLRWVFEKFGGWKFYSTLRTRPRGLNFHCGHTYVEIQPS